MSSSQSSSPRLLSISPRFVVQDLEQALAFYRHLGFQTTYQDEAFAIVERDGISLHFNYSSDPPKSHSVCWISVTRIEELYQQYLPTQAIQSPLEAKPWSILRIASYYTKDDEGPRFRVLDSQCHCFFFHIDISADS